MPRHPRRFERPAGWRYGCAVSVAARPAAILALLVTCTAVVGCVQRPDAATCEAAGKHMIELYKAHKESSGDTRPGKLSDKDLEAFKKGCVNQGTQKEVDCVQSATAWTDVEACIR